MRCIYKIHAKHPIILENVPKLIDPRKLTGFKISARHARDSILGHNNILWSNGAALPRSREEPIDLGVEENENDDGAPGNPPVWRRDDVADLAVEPVPGPNCLTTQASVCVARQTQASFSPIFAPHQQQQFDQSPPEIQSLDFFRPFHDPEMLDLFPNGQALDFPYYETGPTSLDFWNSWSPDANGFQQPCVTEST